MDEFALIRKYLAPLAGDDENARGLQDDVAFFPHTGQLISKDMLVAGIHFFANDPLNLVAQKALRVNVSDIVAKGGRPAGYFLGIVWPAGTKQADVGLFAQGLAEDQNRYALCLLGGDTTRHTNSALSPLVISITMLGHLPTAPHTLPPPQRSGARPGDHVFVTGTIGDSLVGRMVRQEQVVLPDALQEMAYTHYLLPEPAVAFPQLVPHGVTASLDISDGLIADATHIARQSGVDLILDAERIPISAPAKAWQSQQGTQTVLQKLVSGGDDYQVLCTVCPTQSAAFVTAARQEAMMVTQIGVCCPPAQQTGTCHLFAAGKNITPRRTGFAHF